MGKKNTVEFHAQILLYHLYPLTKDWKTTSGSLVMNIAILERAICPDNDALSDRVMAISMASDPLEDSETVGDDG